MSDTAAITPFTLDVPQAELDDLRRRLLTTRWPDAETVEDTSQGPRLEKVRALVEHWTTEYDWRRTEALLNGWGQHTTHIDGLEVHFLHVRSAVPGARPLLLTHGWPGSVLEFRHAIGPLTDPVAHGGDAADAFHVVIPSLPGFGFSGKPTTTGWNTARTARAWSVLMSRLGYTDWFAQGGDLGATVTAELAALQAAGDIGLAGIHLNMALFMPTDDEARNASPDERVMLQESGHYWRELSAYSQQMSTRPQTIGYSLADSPSGWRRGSTRCSRTSAAPTTNTAMPNGSSRSTRSSTTSCCTGCRTPLRPRRASTGRRRGPAGPPRAPSRNH